MAENRAKKYVSIKIRGTTYDLLRKMAYEKGLKIIDLVARLLAQEK